MPRLNRRQARTGFTLIELLVAMALITATMAVLSQAFVGGLETFRRLKGIGDLNERLRGAAIQLRRDVADAHFESNEFIRESIRSGQANSQAMADLRARYEAIRADAEDLDGELREVLRATTNPVARRVMQVTLQALTGVRLQATNAVDVLELIDPDDE